MRAPKKKPTAEKLRSWSATLMRSRNQFLGIVYAADEKSAEAGAIAEFRVREDMRRRLIMRPTHDWGIDPVARSQVRPLSRHWLGVRDARRSPLERRARVRVRRGGDAVSVVQSIRQGSSAAPAEGF